VPDGAKKRRRLFLVLGIVLAGLILVAVGLILYFALKR
jgi:flagellar basal body-associated protein FliL